MSSNKHHISVSAFNSGDTIYMAHDAGFYVNYISYKNGRLVAPKVILDSSWGDITSSKLMTQFKLRECFHYYADFKGLIGFWGIPDLGQTLMPRNSWKCRYFTKSGVIQQTLYEKIVGKGTVNSNGSYSELIYTDSAGYQYKYYGPKGILYFTVTATLDNIDIPQSFTGSVEMTYTTVQVCTAAGKAGYCFDGKNTWKTTVKLYSLGTVSSYTPPSSEELIRSILSHASSSLPIWKTPDSITDDIFDKLVIPDVNNLENLRELKNIRKNLPPIIKLLRQRNFKSLAEFYLWYKYSYQTTCMDLKSYWKFFQDWTLQSTQGYSSQTIRPKSYQFSNSASDFSDMSVLSYSIRCKTYTAGVLEALGLSVNLSNTWDLLPFSFVADWFINLGDTLATLDRSDVLSKINVLYCVTSYKNTRLYSPLQSLGCFAQCRAVRYRRLIDTTLPQGNVSIHFKDPSHYITNGAALIVANKH